VADGLGQPCGVVGAGVVDDEDVGCRDRGPQPMEDLGDVLGLLVGGQDHEGAHGRA